MGFLGGLFGGYEKLEQRGDVALGRGEPLEALHSYRDALRKVETRDPAAAERLRSKAEGARTRFLESKLTEAKGLAEDDLPDDALEVLGVVAEHLEEGDRLQRRQLEELRHGIEERLASRAEADLLDPTGAAAATLPPDATGRVEPARAREEEEDEEGKELLALEGDDLDAVFEQFAGALPEEDRERALAASADFKRGYMAHQQGLAAEAATAFERAALQAPEDALVLEHLALALDLADRPGEAAERYRAALEREPGRHNARIALAGIVAGVKAAPGVQPFGLWRQEAAAPLRAGADPQAGLALLADGARTDPDRAGAYLAGAAELGLGAGRPREAVALAEQALAAGGTAQTAVLRHLQAVARELAGEVDGAQHDYDQATQLGGHALFFRAEFAEFALRHGRALEDAEKTIFETCMGCQASQPTPEELDYYGFLLTRLQHARGELSEALKGIDRLLSRGAPPVLEGPLRDLRRRVQSELAQRRSARELGADKDDAPV